MSKVRITALRLFALGGLTALSGSSLLLLYQHYSVPNDTAECRPHMNSFNLKDTESIVKEQVSHEWDDDWDCRKPKYCKKLKHENREPSIPAIENSGQTTEVQEPTATRHVILVRHGQYNMETRNASEKILTAIGRQQAAATGDRLKSLNIKFNRITASTMVRAQETANIIHGCMPDVPFTECSMLREGAPMPPNPAEGTTLDRWICFQDNPRIEGAFRKYIHRAKPSQKQDSYDLVVGHGNVIGYFVCRALQFPPENYWLRMNVAHCGVTWLTIEPNGNVSLQGYGNTGHLTPELVTGI